MCMQFPTPLQTHGILFENEKNDIDSNRQPVITKKGSYRYRKINKSSTDIYMSV